MLVVKGNTMPNDVQPVPRAPLTQEQLELIKNTVAKGATNDELKLFLIAANRTGLDPFTKQIHFVKRAGRGSIQTGIDGYRAIAERSGTLAGIDDAVYDTESEPHPNKATVRVYRIVNGIRVEFSASARWDEYVPPPGQDFMWRKMPYFMLGKVAEALALRKAFPNDLTGLYVHEEMQHGFDGDEDLDGMKAKIVGNQDTNQLTFLPSEGAEGQSGESAETKPPSKAQLRTIEKLMQQKGVFEEEVVREGFPPMAELSGGKEGSPSKLIDWLIKSQRRTHHK